MCEPTSHSGNRGVRLAPARCCTDATGNCGSVRARRYCATTSRLGTTTLRFDDDSSWASICGFACRYSCHWEKRSRLAQWRNVARRRSLRKEALAWNPDGSSLFVQLESAATWSCLALIGYCHVSECYCYGHRFESHCTCCLVEKENRKIGSLKIVQMLQRVSKSAHHYGNIPMPERDATGIG